MTELPDMSDVSSLGAFSLSSPVADVAASTAFYEKLGFTAVGSDDQTWTMLMNGNCVVGVFHGMFDKPMLTFNPDTFPVTDKLAIKARRTWTRMDRPCVRLWGEISLSQSAGCESAPL